MKVEIIKKLMTLLRFLPKYLLASSLIFLAMGCSSNTNPTTFEQPLDAEKSLPDTLIYKSNVMIEGDSFLILRMNHAQCRVELADSVIPNINDSTIALCVEAAFTGELLKEFKSKNVAGDYVVNGKLKKGYRCNVNTGFLGTLNGVPFISSVDKLQGWLEGKHDKYYCMFQQVLLVQDGKDVYTGKPIKATSKNIYRAACIMSDGNFAVIQSQETLSLGQFIRSLVNLGVSDALYLDMGTGWNYGWYRETLKDAPIRLFDYRTPYQTSWLLIKAREDQ